jgi:hypothetical protein
MQGLDEQVAQRRGQDLQSSRINDDLSLDHPARFVPARGWKPAHRNLDRDVTNAVVVTNEMQMPVDGDRLAGTVPASPVRCQLREEGRQPVRGVEIDAARRIEIGTNQRRGHRLRQPVARFWRVEDEPYLTVADIDGAIGVHLPTLSAAQPTPYERPHTWIGEPHEIARGGRHLGRSHRGGLLAYHDPPTEYPRVVGRVANGGALQRVRLHHCLEIVDVPLERTLKDGHERPAEWLQDATRFHLPAPVDARAAGDRRQRVSRPSGSSP